jgi:hypothetical protein
MKNPTAFHHNSLLLEVATMFETYGLGPEFVPQGQGRTPDLVLRLTAAIMIQIDTKAPKNLQMPIPGSEISVDPSQPRETIHHALRLSRGQFSTDGILVVGGDFWVGGIDAFAEAAAAYFEQPLAADASDEAQQHYARLLGVILASQGYDEREPGAFRSRLYLRWVRNPRYEGHIYLTLPPDMEGLWRLRAPAPAREVSDLRADEADAEREETHGNPARFRRLAAGTVEVEGLIINSDPDRHQSDERVAAFQLPVGYRPAGDVEFDVACETGFTAVEVRAGGHLLVNPRVGWIDLHGIRFRAA